jgi:hypothetical protein
MPLTARRARVPSSAVRPGTLSPAWLVGAWPVLIACLVSGAAWGWAAGPRWSWDRGNHHVYGGLQWLDGRLGEGVLPAGGQTFLNPLAYVPVVALERAGWPASSIAMALGALQALCVFMVWMIARVCVGPAHSGRTLVPAVATLLAAATPVFLLTLGSTYSDGTTAVGVLAGVWCALRAVDGGPHALRWAAAAGLAMGAMAGLKLSHLLPAVLGWVLIAVPPPGASRLRWPATWGAYVLAGLLGAALTHGGWSLQLQRVAGHPLYPILGTTMLSDPAVPGTEPTQAAPASTPREQLAGWVARTRISGSRFTPDSLQEWLSFPLRVADPSMTAPQAYVEARYPDPRLLLVAALAAAMALCAWRRTRVASGAARVAIVGPPGRPALRLAVFAALWYLAWTLSSSNGRYGLPLLMLLSVPLAHGACVLLAPGRARTYGLGALLGVQAVFAFGVAEHRYDDPSARWAAGAFQVELPATLRDESWLHVPISMFSGTYLLPAMHPRSTFANLWSVCERCDGPRGVAHARQVLDAWSGRVRLLALVDRIDDGRPYLSAAQRAAADGLLAPYDLRLDGEACEFFTARPNLWGGSLVERRGDTEMHRPSDLIASCRVVADPVHAAAVRARRTARDAVFEALERRCADELGGQAESTRLAGERAWARVYTVPELLLTVSNEIVQVTSRRGVPKRLGSVDDVLADRVDCGALKRQGDPPATGTFDPNLFFSGAAGPAR